MPSKDRFDVGRQLASALARYKDHRPVVLALPRGGVPVAAEVAAALDAPFDLILLRKIGLPFQPELAMGAVVDGGAPIVACNEEVIELAGIDQPTFEAVCEKELGEIDRRRKRYLGTRERTEVAARTVILIDDGIATGATVRAALRAVRLREPKLILAVPVATHQEPQRASRGCRRGRLPRRSRVLRCDRILLCRLPTSLGQGGGRFGHTVYDSCESAGTSRSDTANSVNPLATKCLCAEGEESEGNFPGCSSPARVFTGGAEAMWREPPIDEVVVTDAVPVTSVNEAGRKRLVVLQTADLFADVIRS